MKKRLYIVTILCFSIVRNFMHFRLSFYRSYEAVL